MAGFSQNQGSRVFHLMMIIPAGILLLLLSLISLGTLAAVNRELVNLSEPREDVCVLYVESSGPNLDIEGQDEKCTYSIAGGGILAFLSLGFTAVLVAKAFIGLSVFSVLTLIELVMSVAGTVWAFVLGVVITAGLDQTCEAFVEVGKEHNLNYEKYPCCSYFFHNDGDVVDVNDITERVYFYEGVNASRITAWLAMVVLLAMSALYTILLLKFCLCGGSVTRGSSKMPAPEPTTNKTVPV